MPQFQMNIITHFTKSTLTILTWPNVNQINLILCITVNRLSIFNQTL